MAGFNLLIDHVVFLVPDAAEAARTLRDRGLGSERGAYHPFAGTRNHKVPLQPPAYLEFLAIESRSAAESSEAGRAVLACEAVGFGVFSWAVLVEDLEAASSRLGIGIVDYTRTGRERCVGGARLPALLSYRYSSTIRTMAIALAGGERCTTEWDTRVRRRASPR
jgi:hypothetical protein